VRRGLWEELQPNMSRVIRLIGMNASVQKVTTGRIRSDASGLLLFHAKCGCLTNLD
jgi:hypothetical protein